MFAMGPRAFFGFLRGLVYALRGIDEESETPGVEAVEG